MWARPSVYTDPVNPMPSIQTDDLKSLVSDMNAGKVDWLVILNANPLYAAPVDLDFESAMGKVKTVVHLGSHIDETGEAAHWHINNQHYMEMWSDARAYDGTVSIVQPMIDPMYGGHAAHEFIQSMLDEPDVSAYDAVRANWKQQLSKGDFEFNWRKALHDGWIADTAFQPKRVGAKAQSGETRVQTNRDVHEFSRPIQSKSRSVPDANVYDGRYANVGWMQEIPRPVTNLAWDNAAQMSFATLEKFGLAEDDAVEISVGGKKIIAGALAVPGQADGVVVVTLGQGRRSGRVGGGVGYNAYLIQQSGSPWAQTGAQLRKTGDIYDLCVTKSHHIDQRTVAHGGDGSGTHSIEGNEALDRGIIRFATLEEFKADPNFANERRGARHAGAGHQHLPVVSLRQECLGHVDRSEFVRGLQCLRDGVLRGEQYSGGGAAAGEDRPHHAVDPDRYVLRRRSGGAARALPADDVPPLRERAVRAGVPGGRDGAFARRPESDGLQPLRGYAVLLQQLSLQGAAVQLPACTPMCTTGTTRRWR